MANGQPLEQQQLATEKAAMAASVASLGIALSGAWLYPPLGLLSIASTAYAALPIFESAAQSILGQHKASQAVTDSVIVLTCLATNHFIVAAMAVGLHHIGDNLTTRRTATHRTRLVQLLQQQNKTVWVQFEGGETQIVATELKTGDKVLLEAGESCPVMGTITDGLAWLEQAGVDGDTCTVLGQADVAIPAGTRVLTGRICVQVEQPIRSPNPADVSTTNQPKHSPPARVHTEIDSPADPLAAPLLILSALSTPFLGITGAGALLNATGIGNLKQLFHANELASSETALAGGILLKDHKALSTLQQVNAVVFDLATLYEPFPALEEIYTCQNFSANEVLTYATAAAQSLMHPLVNVLRPEVKARCLQLPLSNKVAERKAENGVQAWIDQKLVYVGDAAEFMRKGIALPADFNDFGDYCRRRGHRALLVAVDNECFGALELGYHTRPEAHPVLRRLREQQLPIYAIGDVNLGMAPALLENKEIDQVFDWHVWPQCADIIAHLQSQGKTVCYIGNRATQRRAMQQANLSISIAESAMLAQNAAQIVLLNNNLAALETLWALARQTDAHFKTSLLATLLPNAVCMGGIVLGGWGLGASVAANALGLAMTMSQYPE